MEIVSSSLQFVSEKYKVKILGYVFMPNHIHLILFLDEPQHLSSFMRDFKKYSSTQIRKQLEKENRSDLVSKMLYEKDGHKFKVWKDRFDDFHIEQSKSLEIKLNYIHENPVRKGMVENASDYLYSSAGYYFENKKSFMPVIHFLEAIGYANHYSFGRIY